MEIVLTIRMEDSFVVVLLAIRVLIVVCNKKLAVVHHVKMVVFAMTIQDYATFASVQQVTKAPIVK